MIFQLCLMRLRAIWPHCKVGSPIVNVRSFQQSRERTTDPIHSQDCRKCNFQSIEPSQAEIIMADADLAGQVLSWGSY